MKVFQILKSITGFDKATRTLTDVQRITELFKAQQYSNLFAFLLHIILRHIHEGHIKLNNFQWLCFVKNCLTAIRVFMYGIQAFYKNDEAGMTHARMALLGQASVMSESLEELRRFEVAFDAIKDYLPNIPTDAE
jgi:hypothetical protein